MYNITKQKNMKKIKNILLGLSFLISINAHSQLTYITDSIVRISNTNDTLSKVSYEYDDKGNIVRYNYYYKQDASNQIELSSFLQYKFDDYNNEIENIQASFDFDIQSWDTTQFIQYNRTYNINKQLVQVISQFQSQVTKLFTNSSKSEYIYDANGYKSEYVNYYWNSENLDWNNSLKFEYQYSSDGKLLLEKSYDWNNDSAIWILDDSIKYTYTTNNNKLKEIWHSLDVSSNTWFETLYVDYVYDSNNKLISREVNTKPAINSEWRKSSKNVFYYNLDNFLIADSTYGVYINIDEGYSEWILSGYRVYSYDSRGNRIDIKSYQVDIFTDEFIGISHTVQIFDNNNIIVESTTNEWDTLTGVFKTNAPTVLYYKSAVLYMNENQEEYIIEINTNGNWSATSDVPWISFYPSSGFGNDTIYITCEENTSYLTRIGSIVIDADNEYSLKSTNTQTIKIIQVGILKEITTNVPIITQDINIYPNPASTFINVNINEPSKINILSIDGTIIKQCIIENNNQINIDDLPSGIYFVQIENQNIMFTKKIIVK